MAERVVLITGSSSGFGELTARLLAERGFPVYASMRDVRGRNAGKAEELSAWAARSRARLEVVELDVTDERSVEAAVGKVIDSAGRIDVVVNNAGIGAAGFSEAFTVQDAQRLFDVNFFGAHRVNRAVLPHMRARFSGLLIHVSSTVGRLLFPFLGPYCPSKFALEAYAESLRYELAPLGVDSVIVEPGPHMTGHQQRMLLPSEQGRIASYGEAALAPERMSVKLGKLLSGPDGPDPMDVAKAILSLIERRHGERPLRTVVDKAMGSLVETVNDKHRENQKRLLDLITDA